MRISKPILESIHYIIEGPDTGRKLVFLHGLMGSAANWRKITSAFEGPFQILTYDQRGHGKSFKPSRGFAPEDFARDLKGILDELGWKSISLVGHSMGGRNAIAFADLYTSRVERLIVEDIGPESSAESSEQIRSLLESVPVPFPNKLSARDFFRNQFESLWPDNRRIHAVGMFFYTNIEEKADGRADWRFSKEAILQVVKEGRKGDLWRAVENLSMPTLFIRGSESVDFSQEELQKVLNSNPGIQGKTVEGSGHWVHFDQHKKFIQLCQDFLGEIEN